ncbi:unnamed protein product [Malus baccata var. baccata]
MEPEVSELPKGLMLGRDENRHIRLTGSTPLDDVGCCMAPPQKPEVRLKILFTALCHTDGQQPLFPRIFRHEAGGVVESGSEGVTELQPDDHVFPVFTGECKECTHCKSEESNMCDLLRINTDRGAMLNDGQSRFSKDGKPIYHFVGAMLNDGQSRFSKDGKPIYHFVGLTRLLPLTKFAFLVAEYGQAAEGARILGCSRIIGVDLNSNRFEEAKKFGVNEFVNPKDHNKPVQEGWGLAVLVGVPNKDDAFKTHPMNFLNERTLKGTFYGNYKSRTDLPGVVEKYMNKELELDKFITHSVSFADINKAFDLMLSGQSIRCVIRMGN